MALNSPVAVKLDDGLRQRVKRLADARQRTSHWLLHEAIVQFVEREESRESFRKDATLAWEAYQAGGGHVKQEAADAWLAGLSEGIDVDPPAPKRST
jgi:predicted transcriptional regulator